MNCLSDADWCFLLNGYHPLYSCDVVMKTVCMRRCGVYIFPNDFFHFVLYKGSWPLCSASTAFFVTPTALVDVAILSSIVCCLCLVLVCHLVLWDRCFDCRFERTYRTMHVISFRCSCSRFISHCC
jgi:succinate dehydrogenase/fumarate reductase cytochrome b subunit